MFGVQTVLHAIPEPVGRFLIVFRRRNSDSLTNNRPMPSSGHYKSSAEECRRLAEEAHDEVERETLLRMAAQWERLAAHKTKIEAGEAGSTST
jgi:hypothetical protein